ELRVGKFILRPSVESRNEAPEVAGAVDKPAVLVMPPPLAFRAGRPHQTRLGYRKDVVPIEDIALWFVRDRLQHAEKHACIAGGEPQTVFGFVRSANPLPSVPEVG